MEIELRKVKYIEIGRKMERKKMKIKVFERR